MPPSVAGPRPKEGAGPEGEKNTSLQQTQIFRIDSEKKKKRAPARESGIVLANGEAQPKSAPQTERPNSEEKKTLTKAGETGHQATRTRENLTTKTEGGRELISQKGR